MNQREFIASLNKTQHLYFAKKSNQAGLKHPAQQWGVMHWLAWSMPYHAEHHVYPAVPFFRLRELQAD
jgi:fatty acid desaturase